MSKNELKYLNRDEIFDGLVNGLQRLNASRDVGLDTIPCQVISCEDRKAELEAHSLGISIPKSLRLTNWQGLGALINCYINK